MLELVLEGDTMNDSRCLAPARRLGRCLAVLLAAGFILLGSATLLLAGERTPTVCTVTSSSNPSLRGQCVTLTATVSGWTVAPTGVVEFHLGTSSGAIIGFGTPVDGEFSMSTSSLALGDNQIFGVFKSDLHNEGSSAPVFVQTVVEAPMTVSGTVRSAATGVPIPFAGMQVFNSVPALIEPDLRADYAGRYSVQLPPGTYTFHVTGPGWSEVEQPVTVPDSDYARDFELTDHHEQLVYRFFNMKGGVHFYTASDAEFINVYSTLGATFKYDGPAYSVSLLNTLGQVPLYRFFNRRNGVHFYTASEAEKTRVQTTLASTYNYEGIAYGVRIDGKGIPVYRFYVPARNAHFYTAATGEIFKHSGLSTSYRYEGIGYWVAGGTD